jgi:hypothetical protein
VQQRRGAQRSKLRRVELDGGGDVGHRKTGVMLLAVDPRRWDRHRVASYVVTGSA